MRTSAACILLLFCQVAVAAEAPVIGRLFAPAGAQGAGQAAANRIRVDGAVARSSGRNTVWLNGLPTSEAGGTAHTSPDRLPAVALGQGRVLRVGEVLEVDSGQRRDLLPEGAVVRGK